MERLTKKKASEVICTRSALLGEKTESAKGGQKKSAATKQLALGGTALATGKGKGKGAKVKAEDRKGLEDMDPAAWSRLYKSAPAKCAAHLPRRSHRCVQVLGSKGLS